jgi:glycosyltransferase involved in cell wall biosynthesis
MRILHTIDSLGIYGAETMLLNLAEQQRRGGHTPIILSIGNPDCAEKPLEAEAAQRGLQCIPHRMRDGLNFRGAARILRLARQQQIDVIHSHGYKTNILLGALPEMMRPCPIVTTLHGWTAKKKLSKLGLYCFIDQHLLHRLNAVVVVNEQLKSTPTLRMLDQRRIHAIANGITVADEVQLRFDFAQDPLGRELLALKKDTGVLVGAVGRLSPEKNFGALIEALQQVGNSRVGVAILGDGPELALLRDKIAAAGLQDRVLLGGYVKDARKYLELFDVLVIPSLTEGLPMILLEAMSANTPVIATSVGDIPATLGGLGQLIEPGNVGALAASLRALIATPALFRDKAAKGRQRVIDHYSAVAMAARYETVYRAARPGRDALAPLP